MSNIVLVPDHRDRAVAALLAQYRDKPRMKALAESLGGGAQTLENQAFGLLTSSTLSAASGDLLDKWGAVVGEERGGLDDDDYRVFIEARILVNNCEGTTDQIIAIWQLIVAPYLVVRHVDNYPASFSLWVVRSEAMTDIRARRVGRLMRAVKPGGIAMDLIEAVSGYYGFTANPDAFSLDVGTFARAL